MNTTFKLFLFLLLAGGTFLAFAPQSTQDEDGITRLEIGDELPMSDVKMMNITEKEVSLDDIMGTNGLLLNFSCNTCPFVIAYENRYPMVEKLAKQHGVGLALINSNEAKRVDAEGADTFEKMQSHAKEAGYNSYYLVDKNHELADAIGAFTTPHVFLFNAKKELVYKGAIDDNWKSKDEVKENYLQDAIESMVNGEEIEVAETKGRGCSIKRLK